MAKNKKNEHFCIFLLKNLYFYTIYSWCLYGGIKNNSNKEEFMSDKKIILPYFARFLEGDVKKEELKNIKGGAPTHKFPSDRDEAQYTISVPFD